MKLNFEKTLTLLSCIALLGGCAQQQQQHKYTAAAPAKTGGAIAYFPSGRAEGSGLMLEKIAPAEVIAGQPYQYSYKVSNLTDLSLEKVMVTDRVGSNFSATDSDPKATSNAGGIATWDLGTLGPKQSKTITVNGNSPEEGTVTTCGWATYIPVVCQDIRVVKANIALTKTAPSDGLLCDPIPYVVTVKNTGSSALTGVQVTDPLPSGLTSDGKSALTFDVGNLAPGESKEFKYNATAGSTGKFVNTAKVTSKEGVTAESAVTTAIHQPVLTISCKASDQQFMGRNFEVCYNVANTGDAAANAATLSVPVPAGLTVVSSTGTVKDGNLVFDLGSIAAGASQNVCATFMSPAAATFQLAGTAKAGCATPVSSTCTTRVVGLSAVLLEKADDPDPVSIGDTTTYTVKVTNQGTADDHHVQVVVTIADELVPVSATDGGVINGQVVTFPVVDTLGSKQAVGYKIVAKGVKAGDGHTKFTLSCDLLKSPISAEESTTVY